MKVIAYAVIAFLVLIVYSPSFLHVPRADQIMYLAEVAPKTSLWELTIGSLDLNRHRQFNPGDELLFRPVVYVFLGLEKYLFGYKFMFWQGAGILLHLAVLWYLLRFLFLLSPGWPAVMATVFFAFLFVNMEMVCWSHINSYMIFVLSILAAFYHFWKILNKQAKNYGILFLWLLLAAFTYEMGSVIALFLAWALWVNLPEQRQKALALLEIPVIYAFFSVLNAYVHLFKFSKVLEESGHHGAWWTAPGAVLYSIAVWFWDGLLIHQMHWVTGARFMISSDEKHLLQWPLLSNFASLIAVAMTAVFMFILLNKNNRVALQKKWLVLLMGIFMVIYAAMNFFSRGLQWGIWETIRVNTYYFYIFWIFALVMAYGLIDWQSANGWLKKGLMILVLGFSLINAKNLYALIDRQMNDNNQISVAVNTVELLIKEHGHEPDFSFFMAADYPGNLIYSVMRNKNDPSRRYSLMEALYPRYFTFIHPKYKFLSRP